MPIITTPQPPKPKRTAPKPQRTAVIMCHGMGQQVPFETLNDGVSFVLGTGGKPDSVDFVEHEGCRIPRATVRNEKNEEVDIFEVYWAPLTEGRVTIWDTVRFLIQGSARGIAHGSAKFRRHVFGDYREFPMPRNAGFSVALVLFALTIFALSFLNFCALSISAAFDGAQIAHVVSALLLGLLPAGLVGLVAILAVWRIPVDGPVPNATDDQSNKEEKAAWFEFGILAMICGLAAFDVWLVRKTDAAIFAKLTDNHFPPWWTIPIGIGWCASIVFFLKVREWFLQYIGDVAAYVSSHEVNKFTELRDKIHAVSGRVFSWVYGATDTRDTFRYDRILIAGHSLGSVIAYDGLNRLFADEGLKNKTLNAANRTKLLLTFGSPLDKTAFFFRTQTNGAKTREMLAEKLQALIHDPAYRRFPWINVFATRDIFAGSLDFYDKPEDKPFPEGTGVFNIIDVKASKPILSHTQYYETGYVARFLKAACNGDAELKQTVQDLSGIPSKS